MALKKVGAKLHLNRWHKLTNAGVSSVTIGVRHVRSVEEVFEEGRHYV